jgi:Ser/Thr protein kinase RdoA (MazF antagonist)
MIEPIGPPLADLRRRLQDELGFRIEEIAEVKAGSNNRLFRLAEADGTSLLAKLYYRDDRDRLGREFGALAFLRERGFDAVPTPYLRSDAFSYGVYSYETGATKAAADLTVDDLAGLGRFAVALHRVRPDEPGAAFPTAVAAAFSLGQIVASVDERLRAFRAFAAGPAAYDVVRDFCAALDPARTVAELLAIATSDVTASELATPLPRAAWRLSNSDFAPHNVLVRPDGRICVLDFEYFGWEDPARLAMGFVCHDASLGLAPAAVAAFLRAYFAGRDLPEAELARFERVRRLMEIEWLAIYLTPPSRGLPRSTRTWCSANYPSWRSRRGICPNLCPRRRNSSRRCGGSRMPNGASPTSKRSRRGRSRTRRACRRRSIVSRGRRPRRQRPSSPFIRATSTSRLAPRCAPTTSANSSKP